jgi:cell division protein FtsB
VLKYEWLVALTRLVGAALPTTTLFLGAIVFLMLLGVQFSIKLSRLSDQMKNLAQENALLRAEVELVRGEGQGGKDDRREMD